MNQKELIENLGSLSFEERISDLELRQLVAMREVLESKISEVKSAPARTIWVVRNAKDKDMYFREECYLDALAVFLSSFEENFKTVASDFTANPMLSHRFSSEMPLLTPYRLPEPDYLRFWSSADGTKS
ncbi:hypothetical protein [Janthinobacterium sp. B9-8]|uniref:hypothetical protein n=1 Tax=Janthinobacterium sp. B9-8 TaxID=1236179 RepID=UPI00061CF1F4|nr:hypothetical protein [Janthinobacterium sp. B9-8]AMC34750.1 hypothetical protein VN23_09080 [Janthinobacterium sp. B9-8]